MGTRWPDIVFISSSTAFATLATILGRADLLTSVLMFFGLPATYLALREPHLLRRCLPFALTISVPLSLFFDTLAAINGAWVVPKSILQFRFFGVASVEVYLFGLLWTLFATM